MMVGQERAFFKVSNKASHGEVIWEERERQREREREGESEK